jgi:hypothetical protein
MKTQQEQSSTKRSNRNYQSRNYNFERNRVRTIPFQFNGLASEFPKLEDLFKVNLAQKSASCIPYLLEGGSTNGDERFKEAEVPPNITMGTMIDAVDINGSVIMTNDNPPIPVQRPANDNDILRRNQIRQMAIQTNEKLYKIDSLCMEALTPLLSEIIQTSLIQFNGDPLATWEYLKSTYGPASDNAAASRTALLTSILDIKMEYHDTFAAFIIKFNKMCDTINLSDDVKAALLSIKTNSTCNYRLQILPDRLIKEVQECIKQGKSYTAMIDYISRADEFAHQHNQISKEETTRQKFQSSNKTINGVQKCKECEKSCKNCGNQGHDTDDCKLDACGKCKRFGIGHNYNTCYGPAKQKPPTKSIKTKQTMKEKQTDTDHKQLRKMQKQINQIQLRQMDKDAESYNSEEDTSESEDSAFATSFSVRRQINMVTNQFQVDSGAAEHVSQNTDGLTNVKEAPPGKTPKLYAANDQAMTIKQSGTASTLIKDPVYISEEMGSTKLLSGPRIQKQGWWLIFPPTKDQDKIGCLMTDKNGQIMATTDVSLMVDPSDIKPSREYIKLPYMSTLINNIKKTINYFASHPKQKITNLKGYNGSREDLVNIVHAIGHWSKEDMIWMAKNSNIIGFPVTEQEIRSHLKPCNCCPRGEFRRDATNHNDFKQPNNRQPRNTHKDKSDRHALQIRNNEIGYEVGIDIYTYRKHKKLNARDKASGFAIDVNLPNDSKASIGTALQAVLDIFKKYGHHSTDHQAPVNILRKDNEAVLRTTKINNILQDNGITPRTSPSHHHQYNGLIEVDTRIIGNKTIASNECAPHIQSPVTWKYIWSLQHAAQNMRPTKRAQHKHNKTRYQDFTGEIPNWYERPLLPAGQPVNFWVPQPAGQGTTRCHIGAYLMYDPEVPGGIQVLDMETGRISKTASYKVLNHVPSAFTKIHTSVWQSKTPYGEQHIPTVPYIPVNAQDNKNTVLMPTNEIHDTSSATPTKISLIPEETLHKQVPTTGRTIPSHKQKYAHEGVQKRTNTHIHEGAVQHNDENLSTNRPKPPAPPVHTTITNHEQMAKTAAEKWKASQQAWTNNMAVKDAIIHAVKNKLSLTSIKQKKSKKKRKKSNADSPTVTQAQKREDWQEFSKAIDTENQQLADEECFEDLTSQQISKIPTKDIIGTMYRLQIKRSKITRKVEQYKARLVALGNQQMKHQYDQLKSPTARSSSVKLILSIQAKLGSKSRILDIKGAYLKSIVPQGVHIYLRLPNGKIVKLKKYIYGLKQAGYEWSKTLHEVLTKAGYNRSTADPCIYSLRKTDGDYIIFSTHVDDFYVIANKNVLIDDLQDTLTEAFGTVKSNSSETLTYLGINITKTEKGDIEISQRAYLEKLLEIANMNDCKPVKTPYSDFQSTQPDDKNTFDKNTYLQLMGALIFPAGLTRPDLSYAVHKCAQKCSKPNLGDFRRVKRILRYIKGTLDYKITFGTGDGKIRLYGYVDAAYQSYPNGASQYGYSFSLYGTNRRKDATFYARSVKLKLVVLSSTEAEYVALCEACTEILFLRTLLNDIGFPQNKPTIIYEDNQSVIQMVKGKGNHQRTKHINAKYHFSRQCVNNGQVQLKYCPTKKMVADILTKGSIPSKQFTKLCAKLNNGIISNP